MFNLQLFRSAQLALAIALTSTIAQAEEVAAEDQQDIIVNGVMIAQSRAGTKTDTPLRDVPQARSAPSGASPPVSKPTPRCSSWSGATLAPPARRRERSSSPVASACAGAK